MANATNEAGVKTFTVNMKNNVDLGANGSIKAGNTTLDASGLTAGATKVGADGVSVGSTAVTADGVSVGDAALTADGLAIVGGPSVTKDGINAGGKVIGNLGEGAVAAGSKDAVPVVNYLACKKISMIPLKALKIRLIPLFRL
mgnify:CR=1 FL=1